MSGNCELGRGLLRRDKNATEVGARRFEKPALDARAAPPEAHKSLISRKTVEEVPLTGLCFVDPEIWAINSGENVCTELVCPSEGRCGLRNTQVSTNEESNMRELEESGRSSEISKSADQSGFEAPRSPTLLGVERYKDYTVMYRPFGPRELVALAEANFTAWPPRLPEQPIFYPVTNSEYASDLTARWNVPEMGAGFVAKFRVRNEFADRYPIQQVGGKEHTEWWIPASDLDEMNRHLVGLIEITEVHGWSDPYSDLIALSANNEQYNEQLFPEESSEFQSYLCRISWASAETAAKHSTSSHLECSVNILGNEGQTVSCLVGLVLSRASDCLEADRAVVELVAFHPIPSELTEAGKSLQLFDGKRVLGEVTFIPGA